MLQYFDLANAWMLLPASLGAIVLTLLLVWAAKIPLIYNLRNLQIRYRTTLLTAVAFTMVIGVLTFMMGFINGLRVLTQSSGIPENVIVLSQGSTDEGISTLAYEDMSDIAQLPQVKREEDEPLCSREAYIVINQPIENPLPGRAKRRLLQVRGLDDPRISAIVHGFSLEDGGEWFSAAGVRANPAPDQPPMVEVILGEGIARELGADRSPEILANAKDKTRLTTGDTITLETRTLYVSGILKTGGTTFDSELWAKRSVIGPIFGKNNYTTLVLKTKSPEAAEELESFLTGKDVDNKYEKARVNAFTEPNYFKSLGQTNLQLLIGTIFVAIVMAFGGIMGVMNTMFAAISQRMKDIGVLRLLGYGGWQILISFLFESMMIALFGGLLGCALGYASNGYSMTSVVSNGPGAKAVVFRIVVDAGVIGIGLALSLAMGFFGGLLPAQSAIRYKPLESLRG
jgi:ABC-type lipoprotein release transport system permease subunit